MSNILLRALLLFLLLSGNALADNALHLYNWNNYISAETVARFEGECSCRVVQDYYSDNEEMLAKLAAGATGYDIIVPTGNAMESLIRQQALRPLDKSKLPNLKNINPAYLGTAFDPGNRFSVPYAYTLTLLGYNVQKMRELGFPCCARFSCVHAVANTPAQQLGVLLCSTIPVVSAFPGMAAGSACAMSFSRIAQRSLTLRPAHSRCHLIL